MKPIELPISLTLREAEIIGFALSEYLADLRKRYQRFARSSDPMKHIGMDNVGNDAAITGQLYGRILERVKEMQTESKKID